VTVFDRKRIPFAMLFMPRDTLDLAVGNLGSVRYMVELMRYAIAHATTHVKVEGQVDRAVENFPFPWFWDWGFDQGEITLFWFPNWAAFE